MRLVNPGAGEISDRLTILTLKILHGVEQEKDTAHFEKERTTLLTMIHSRTLNALWFDAMLELGGINAMLWHAEDDLRILRQQYERQQLVDTDAVVLIAFRLQRLNDQRAALVQQINKDAGDSVTQEK